MSTPNTIQCGASEAGTPAIRDRSGHGRAGRVALAPARPAPRRFGAQPAARAGPPDRLPPPAPPLHLAISFDAARERVHAVAGGRRRDPLGRRRGGGQRRDPRTGPERDGRLALAGALRRPGEPSRAATTCSSPPPAATARCRPEGWSSLLRGSALLSDRPLLAAGCSDDGSDPPSDPPQADRPIRPGSRPDPAARGALPSGSGRLPHRVRPHPLCRARRPRR